MASGTWLRPSVLALMVIMSAGANPACLRNDDAEEDEPKPFERHEVIGRDLLPTGFQGSWVSGTEFIYTSNETGNIVLYDVVLKNQSTLVFSASLTQLNVVTHFISPDRKYFLLSYDHQPVFRHSSLAKYAIYSISKGAVEATLASGKYLQLVKWGPVGNSLAYVMDNDIYYVKMATNESIQSPFRLTYDGKPGVIYNGVPDWLYEEEVLETGFAMWFSPDGQRLAYATFNDTLVTGASYAIYGEPGNMAWQYTQLKTIRYPKAGSINPTVTLKTQDLGNTNLTPRRLLAPDIVSEDHLLTSVSWAKNDEVVTIWTNRIQNVAQITRYNVTSSSVVPQLDILVNEQNGWLVIPTPVHDATGWNFVTILSSTQANDKGKYPHLTKVTRTSGNLAEQTPLTSGLWVVTNIYGWDTVAHKIYFQGTQEDLPSRRQVYAITDYGTGLECLSCNVLTVNDNLCQFASASFSPDFSHYALTCSGPDVPHVVLYTTNTKSSLGVWNDNQCLRGILQKRLMPTFEDTRVNVTGGLTAHARLWLPPGLDRSGKTKYPMIVNVYAGPNSQLVTDNFQLGWGAYLTTNRSYVFAMIDGRGSGNKGDRMLFAHYRKLGTFEVEDQINVTRALQAQYPFIDATRTGITGWSYGGYVTAMALAKDTGDVFKCGISVAPVTSWIYYDSAYTERFMRLPTQEDNLQGYENADVTKLVDNFKNKQFFLIHGTADDNVHYQQSMMLTKVLEHKEILFSQQSYPDQDHSILGMLPHLYLSKEGFWDRCFEQETREASHAPLNVAVPALLAVLLVLAAGWESLL